MTEEDDEFLKTYNGKPPAAGPLSEDDLEYILEVFEETAAEQTPYASVDNTVVAYDMMVPALNHLGSASILQHAKAIYQYWKTRRHDMGNKPLHPTLKFEIHQETDDTDPYVCFRRREARQTRKTRARDNKIAETLKRLRRELEDGRQLVLLSYEREMMKRDLLQMDRALFEERARLKQVKVRLGIKGDDDDLVNQKVCDGCVFPVLSPPHRGHLVLTRPQPQKRKVAEPTAAQRPPGTQLRAPIRPDGRTLEQELVLLSDLLTQKEKELREDIESKVQNHRRWNHNHIDLTRDPLSPVKEHGTELKFRPAKTQYLMTPPASISSESMEVDEDAPEPMAVDTRETHPVFLFKAGGIASEQPQTNLPSFRRRIGRLQRLWIDRRGMATPPRETNEYSDRWKYDSDDEHVEPPVYDIDPFDTRALKFRATIPLGQYMYPRAPRPPLATDGANVGPAGNRVLPPPPQAAAAQAQPQAAS